MDRLNKLEAEIQDLRKLLHEKEKELYEMKCEFQASKHLQTHPEEFANSCQYEKDAAVRTQIGERLPKWAIERYSRQILLPEIGVGGQQKLCSAKVLVVGAGGLGCPAAIYLAGAGIGEIGIVDYDNVEITNIHRQILHGECDQYMSKAESAAQSLRRINSRIKVIPYNIQLDSTNAMETLATHYDIVLDCTDNVPSRYLLNDLCVLSKVPLISGSALKMEGQLTIYGYRSDRINDKEPCVVGPCYRCVFPTPPPPAAVGSCSANGVVGPVPGVIGALQALEAIKYIVGQTHNKLLVERMLIFDGEDISFRTVKLRPRNVECAVCTENAVISQLMDYEAFCKTQAKEKKKQESRLKSERRKEEKDKRMTGQSYYGFRITNPPDCDKKKWIQDVPKSERKLGPRCQSEFCSKHSKRHCSDITEETRKEIFRMFWNDLDWKRKKRYVKSLVDNVPPKRRRVKHKGEVSRKGDSKMYHLFIEENRLPVCRLMFLNTLGLKEAMVRCWLLDRELPRTPKKPLKALSVDAYIDSLPKTYPKCEFCRNMSSFQYLNLGGIKNQFQLYNNYVKDVRLRGGNPASRKTFAKVVALKNLRIFKPKNDSDICDIVSQHNLVPVEGPDVNFYYNSEHWQ